MLGAITVSRVPAVPVLAGAALGVVVDAAGAAASSFGEEPARPVAADADSVADAAPAVGEGAAAAAAASAPPSEEAASAITAAAPPSEEAVATGAEAAAARAAAPVAGNKSCCKKRHHHRLQ